jgi:magnesium-transporting ATPase (P-type)
LAKSGVYVSIAVFLILLFWILYSIVVNRDFYAYHEHIHEFVNHIVYCIALVVVTIPEGLKLTETIAVSSSLGKLYNHKS